MFRGPVNQSDYHHQQQQQQHIMAGHTNSRKIRGIDDKSSRQYLDPWDFENYVYIRRNMESSPEPPSITTPSPAGEPISSTFYYIPGKIDDNRGCYAGLDEKTFFNEKFHFINNDEFEEDAAYSTYTDIETSSGDRNSSCGSSVSTLQLHTPGFGVASGQRRMVLPKPPPNLEFPGPPSYDYYELPASELHLQQQLIQQQQQQLMSHHSGSGGGGSPTIDQHSYCSLNDCYECISNSNIPLYDTLRMRKNSGGGCDVYDQQVQINHFGLSKKGLLQIDYSCNWNNLDRYIAK